MKRNLFAVGALLAAVLSLTMGPTASAKPADLPSQGGIECPDGSDDPVGERKFSIELDITPKGITLKLGVTKVEPAAPMMIDALLPAYIEQCLQHLGDMLARPERFVHVDAVRNNLWRMYVAYFPDRQVKADVNDANRQRQDAEARLFDQINVRIKNVPLRQALKNLAFVSGVPIVPDERNLKDAKVNLDAPVSLTLEKTSTYTALQQLLNPLKLTFEIRNDVVMIVAQQARANDASAAFAQRLFETGERCRRAGEFAKARACFQQVHLMTPTTLHGRMAIVRLEEIEERMRDVSEEQGAPSRTVDPEQVFRDMHLRSVPLGLVEVSY